MPSSNPLGLCVHAHFYQPTREDPLTGKIPQEPGAAPYHDWNEKIFDTCYRPNAELKVFERKLVKQMHLGHVARKTTYSIG
jgi:hypothetical protein